MIKRIVKMSFRPEHVSDFKAVFKANKQRIGTFPGCTHLELWQDSEDPCIFFTYSFWNDAGDLEQYRNSELFKNVWAQTKILFREKPQAWSVNEVTTD